MSESDMIKNPVRKNKVNICSKYFLITIIVFFIIKLGAIILGTINSSDQSLKSAATERAYNTLSKDMKKLLLGKINPIISKVAKDPFSQDFQQAMFNEIDKVFVPVYQSIPRFADTHYSVLGEYMEMGAAATGSMTEHIKKQLFSGFDLRLRKAADNIAYMIPEDLQKRMDLYAHNTAQESQIPFEQREQFEAVLSEELKKHMTTFRNTSALTGGFIGAVGGAASIKLIAAVIARKLLIKLGVKYAAKLALKSGSAAGGAATGAALGTFVLPGAGSAIGGVLGAVVGWVTVDKVFVSVDEWLNRDEFEQDLRHSITEQKNTLKHEVALQVNAIKKQLETLAKEPVVGRTPASL